MSKERTFYSLSACFTPICPWFQHTTCSRPLPPVSSCTQKWCVAPAPLGSQWLPLLSSLHFSLWCCTPFPAPTAGQHSICRLDGNMRVLKEPMKNPPYVFVSLVLSKQSAHRMILSERIINKQRSKSDTTEGKCSTDDSSKIEMNSQEFD